MDKWMMDGWRMDGQMDGWIQTCYVPSRQNWWKPLPPTQVGELWSLLVRFAGSDPPALPSEEEPPFLFLESSRCSKGTCRGWAAAGATLWKVISSGQFLAVWEVLK